MVKKKTPLHIGNTTILSVIEKDADTIVVVTREKGIKPHSTVMPKKEALMARDGAFILKHFGITYIEETEQHD